ncbi:MAG: hypothetical protein AAF125_09680 [Chloroflexota bacterium]
MRAYNYLLTKMPAKVASHFTSLPVIQADNVATYIEQLPDQPWTYADFPNVAPPFRDFFVDSKYQDIDIYMGMHVMTYDREDPLALSTFQYHQAILKSDVRWLFLVNYYITHDTNRPQKGVTTLPATMLYQIRSDGLPYWSETHAVRLNIPVWDNGYLYDLVRVPDGFELDIIRQTPKPANAINIDLFEKSIYQAGELTPHLLLTLTFMNTANVRIVDNNAATLPKSTKKRQRLLRRTQQPVSAYKTIQIRPMTRENTDNRASSSEPTYRTTIRRGGFRDYRHGKGLFGRESHRKIYWFDAIEPNPGEGRQYNIHTGQKTTKD